MDELEEMIAFWDDFADDYDSIQEESATTLLDDLNIFVKKQPLFPVSSFLFAQHGRTLTGESPECDPLAVST